MITMKRIKNFAILSIVAFLLGGTIYFSLTVQNQPGDEPSVKGVETDRMGEETSEEKTLAYVTNPNETPQEVTGSTPAATVKPMSPTPTFGNTYNASPTTMLLPTQANPNPQVTLPVAGFTDDLGKIAAGAGLLIITSFLL